jgi:hypothetical protein
MSVFVVSNAHLDALMGFMKRRRKTVWLRGRSWNPARPEDALTLGQILRAANVEAWNARYPDAAMSEAEYARQGSLHPDYAHQEYPRALEPVQALKAVQCLQYQIEQIDADEAESILQQIQDAALKALPGYEHAPWEIEE